MRNMLHLILNTLKVTFRKKGNIIVYLILPFAGLFLSILMYGGAGTQPLRVGIADLDSGRLSSGFADVLKGSEGYKVEAVDEKDVKSGIVDRKYDAVIVIPKGYEKAIFDSAPLKMEIVTVKGQDTTVWLEQYIDIYTRNLADMARVTGGRPAEFDRVYSSYVQNGIKLSVVKLKDEGNAKQVTLSSMGFLIMFVMLGAGFTSQFILNEKRNRTYYRICSAPVSPGSYIAANATTSLVIVAFQIIVIQLVMKYILHMETYIPGPMMFLILMMFGLTAIGISLLVTAFSNSSYMAGTLNTLIVTPTCMLGGCFWPIWFMPDYMQKIAFFVPQRWALDAIDKVQSGGNFEGIFMNLTVLLAFSAALFLIAVYKFSRTESVQKFV